MPAFRFVVANVSRAIVREAVSESKSCCWASATWVNTWESVFRELATLGPRRVGRRGLCIDEHLLARFCVAVVKEEPVVVSALHEEEMSCSVWERDWRSAMLLDT